MDRPVDNRDLISRDEMQAAITGAVKRALSHCEAFVGVFVERRRELNLRSELGRQGYQVW
jgi:hypothetical protein